MKLLLKLEQPRLNFRYFFKVSINEGKLGSENQREKRNPRAEKNTLIFCWVRHRGPLEMWVLFKSEVEGLAHMNARK